MHNQHFLDKTGHGLFLHGPPTRGILQAYYDGHEIALQKSKLLDFLSVKKAPFELFMWHPACKPVGNIEQFPATSVTDVDKRDFVVLWCSEYE